MSATDIVIASAKRTAVGSFNGAFANTPAHELGAAAITAALAAAKIEPGQVDEVILGQILQAGEGQNPARQAAMKAGIPQEKTAFGLNQLCGSGLRAVAIGLQQIANGDAQIIVAGGQESMSQAPHVAHLRNGVKMGDMKFIDSMNKAEAAQKSGRFKDEIAPFTVASRKGDIVVVDDEFIRPGTTYEALAKLRAAFSKEGAVRGGGALGFTNGAGALVITSAAEADKRGLKPLARIASWATAGVDPAVMGTGPIPASRKALEKAGWKIGDLDLIEANEAFAAQAIAVNKDLGWDLAKVNVNGGAIALGHPIGASGARVLITLLFEMQKRNAKKGIATLCIGGGMGIAMCVER